MKKLISLVLALMLCAVAGFAVADEVVLPESAMSFDLAITVPEGYTLTESTMEGELSVNELTPDDEDKSPTIDIMIAYSEEFADISMTKDMSDEQIEGLFELVQVSYDTNAYTIGTTDAGWKYIQCIDNEEDNGYAMILMVHNGYFIETFVNFADYRPMVEADMTTAVALVNSYVITDITE